MSARVTFHIIAIYCRIRLRKHTTQGRDPILMPSRSLLGHGKLYGSDDRKEGIAIRIAADSNIKQECRQELAQTREKEPYTYGLRLHRRAQAS